MCPPCDNELKSEAIIEHLCASEFGKNASLAALGRFGIPRFLLARIPAEQNLLMRLFGVLCSLLPASLVSTFLRQMED